MLQGTNYGPLLDDFGLICICKAICLQMQEEFTLDIQFLFPSAGMRRSSAAIGLLVWWSIQGSWQEAIILHMWEERECKARLRMVVVLHGFVPVMIWCVRFLCLKSYLLRHTFCFMKWYNATLRSLVLFLTIYIQKRGKWGIPWNFIVKSFVCLL